MADEKKLKLLRSVLKALGLPASAIEDIIAWIIELLPHAQAEFPGSDYSAYLLREDFLSAAEHEFFCVLKSAVGDEMAICPKVSLGDIFYAKTGDYANNLSYRNRIERKHVDFLLCDPVTMRPQMGIELDDKRKDRARRDRLVDGVFEAAGLPLGRIRVQRSYDSEILHDLLGPLSVRADNRKVETSMEESQVREARPPACPKCGAIMVLRTAKWGKKKGEQFWGCPDFPRCLGIRQLS
jgi:hypothetical protein